MVVTPVIRASIFCGALAAIASFGGCGTPPDAAAHADRPHARLSDWQLFDDLALLTPRPGVSEYFVNSPLYADGAHIRHFWAFPPGRTIGYSDEGPWTLPIGTVLAQTFSVPLNETAEASTLLETRVLARDSEGRFQPFVYVWLDDQSDAVRRPAGASLWLEQAGRTHHVANEAQCVVCHGKGREHPDRTALRPLGMNTRQLNLLSPLTGENQVDRLFSSGGLSDAPLNAKERAALASPFGTGPLSERARSYLHGNCAHCHARGGHAGERFLWLDYGSTDPLSGDPANWGVCKVPTAAGAGKCGLQYDVVPGAPDASILVCRMESTETQKRMPTLGSQAVHRAGAQLMREWIQHMPAAHCSLVR